MIENGKRVVMTSRAFFGRPGSANLTAGVRKDRRLENHLGTIRNVYFKSCVRLGIFGNIAVEPKMVSWNFSLT